MTERSHGTRAKYVVEKCRCELCRQANRTAENDRFRQQAYGRWQPYVDARPVLAHVRELQASGLGAKRIAALAGVGRGVVSKLLYGPVPSKGVRPENAAKLLALKSAPQDLSGGVLVSGTGTRRRLQALGAAGWSVAQLAERLGRNRTNLWVTLSKDQVEVRTERAVRELYNELWRADPVSLGATQQAVSRTRNYAKAHGWAPVGAWDDDTIDDPNAFPDWTGKCGTPKGYWAHYQYGMTPACGPCRTARADSDGQNKPNAA